MRGLLALAILTVSSVATAQASPKPLFASAAPIRITIQGPIGSISRKAAKSVEPEAATLTLVLAFGNALNSTIGSGSITPDGRHL